MTGGALRPGLALAGRYDLLEVIGEGGMAAVWRAFDLSLRRTVAVKVISERHASNPDFQHRFEREARHVASLSHPGIVAVHDFGVDDQRAFIVMELVEGRSLRQVLDRTGALRPEAVSDLARGVLPALQHAHDRGLIHRDLKPANILITTSGTPKITDFGVARMSSDDTQVTLPGTVVGTVAYAAPEQLGSGAIGPATDLYSFGAVLYECVTGRQPFRGDDAIRVVLQQRFADPDPIDALEPDIPEPMASAIMRALEKEPARRFASADAMAAQLLGTVDPAHETSAGRQRTNDPRVGISTTLIATDNGGDTAVSTELPRRVGAPGRRGPGHGHPAAGVRNRWRLGIVGLAVALAVGGIVAGIDLSSSGPGSGQHRPSNRAAGYGQMLPGQLLTPGQSVLSANRRFGLTMQTDGNLLAYEVAGHLPTWESGTQGSPGAYADMQSDGDLVVYPKGASPPAPGHPTTALWFSGTSGNTGAHLQLQDDGNLEIVKSGSTKALWQTRAVPGSLGSELLPGAQLQPEQYLQSSNGQYRLVNVGRLGVLRLYRVGDPACTIWQEPKKGIAVSTAVMEENGDLTVFGTRPHMAQWQTTTGTNPGASLVLESSGVLLLSSAGGVTLWEAGTAKGRPSATSCAG